MLWSEFIGIILLLDVGFICIILFGEGSGEHVIAESEDRETKS